MQEGENPLHEGSAPSWVLSHYPSLPLVALSKSEGPASLPDKNHNLLCLQASGKMSLVNVETQYLHLRPRELPSAQHPTPHPHPVVP